ASTNTNLLYMHPEELVGKSIWEVLPEQEAAQIVDHIQQALSSGEPVTTDYSLVIRGQEYWFSAIITPLQDGTAMLVARDITDRKQAEEALRESEERYSLAVGGANDGIWDWNLRNNRVYYSPRWVAMLGYEEGEIDNSLDAWFRLVHPDDITLLQVDLTSHIEGETPHLEREYRMRHKDGSYRWVQCRGVAVRGPHGKAYRMAGSLTDITERKAAEEKLIQRALHDDLTGLPNRTLFME
ncbi:MAG: PAS domain S-box protein, partial [Chloroflexota bacterium]